MKQIKLCFIQTNAYNIFNKNSKSIFGGSEIQLYFIAERLSKDRRFDISFIVGDFNQRKIEKFNKIKLYKAFNPSAGDNFFKKIIQAFKYYNLFKKINADIYFTSAANSTVGLVTFFCRKNKKLHIHRTASSIDVNYSFIKANGLIGIIYKYGLKKSDLVITQLEEHKKLLEKNHKIKAKLIRNIFPIKYKKLKEDIILWVSRFDKLKKIELFFELSMIFKKEKFVIICPNDNEKDINYLKLIDKAKKVKNLKFIKKVYYIKIQDFFNKAKIFINTSDYEGFPNTFVQAGISKTPIISLNVNPDNFITKNNCGYYCNGNFNEMVEKTKKLLTNKIDWKEKSNNIYKYVKKYHNIDENINLLKKSIFNLINNLDYFNENN